MAERQSGKRPGRMRWKEPGVRPSRNVDVVPSEIAGHGTAYRAFEKAPVGSPESIKAAEAMVSTTKAMNQSFDRESGSMHRDVKTMVKKHMEEWERKRKKRGSTDGATIY